VGYQLEAELALGEVETTSGNVSAGMNLLAGVRRGAQERGYRLIEYKAARVSGKSPAAAKK
jgi:hypothetical protein